MSTEVKKEIQLEIAHVLFIDIVGYSKLSINEQHTAVEELNQIVRASAQFQKAEADGRLLKIPTGDGMALVFYTTPEAPAQCAMEISRALKEHPRLVLRMGIHSGPVSGVVDVNQRANLAGAGLNIARRVMDCGDAGHILLSKHVAEDLEEYEQWRPLLHELGTCEVKHGARVGIVNLYADQIGNPQLPKKFQALKKHRARVRLVATAVAVLVLAAIVAGIAMFSHYRVRSALRVPEKSIAVLPFENRSRDPDNAYFAEGIQDEILTRLSKIADLKVISRTSTQHYKSTPENLPEIAKRLGVAHILEGSVQKSGDAVRVNVQLIKGANDSHLWADTFDRKLTDIFLVESEVAKAIAQQLQARLTGREQQALESKPTDNPEAHDLYLRGQYLLNRRTGESIQKARELFEQAVAKDANFALGHAGIADSYILLGEYGQLSVSDAASRAWPEVSAALEINEQLAEGYLARAMLLGDFQWKWDAAEKDYRQAIKLNPNNATAHHWFALQLAQQGHTEEALKEIAIAQKHDPLSSIIPAAKAKILLMGRRFAEAIAQCRKALELEPNFAPAYSVLAQAYAFQQQYPEALEAAKKYVDLTGGGDQERLELAYVEALAGKKTEAQQVMTEVQRRGQNFSPYDMSAICVALENQDAALEWIEKAITQHAIDAEWIGVDPRMDSIRGDARFAVLSGTVVGSASHRKSIAPDD